MNNNNNICAISDTTLLVGQQEEHLDCKNKKIPKHPALQQEHRLCIAGC